jgi:uncharacterized repeat protein (TIGR01451 family)
MGASEGTWQGESPGVSFAYHNERKVAVFNVAAGYRAEVTCANTQHGASVTAAPEGTVEGPAQISLTSTDDILFVGFTSSVVPPPPQAITPTLSCVSQIGNGQYRAHFGYTNPNSTQIEIAVGDRNRFAPDPVNRSQPQVFQSGSFANAFEVVFDGQQTTWTLSGNQVSASSSSTPCPGVLRADKLIQPEDDPGQFQLTIDSSTLLRAQNTRLIATTGDTTVQPGNHTVRETAIAPTNPADYDSSVVCRTDGGGGDIVAQGIGPSLVVPVRAGEHVVCAFLNTRKGVQPPGPEADLAITKVVSQSLAQLGQTVTWTVTLRNKGPATATNIRVQDTLPEGVKYVEGSLSVPGSVTCVAAVCSIASLAPGQSLTATFRTTATQVGAQVNFVAAKGDQTDPNPADNAASAELTVEGTDVEAVVPILECVEALPNGSRPRALRLPELARHDRRHPARPPQHVRPASARPRPARPVPPGPRHRRLPGRLRVRRGHVDTGRPAGRGLRDLAGVHGDDPGRQVARPDDRLRPVHARDRRQRRRQRGERRRPGDDRRRHRGGAPCGVGAHGRRAAQARHEAGGLRDDDRLPR